MSYNYLYVLILANFTLLRLLPGSITCKFSAPPVSYVDIAANNNGNCEKSVVMWPLSGCPQNRLIYFYWSEVKICSRALSGVGGTIICTL